MDPLSSDSPYYITRYYTRLAVKPQPWSSAVIATDEGGAPDEHKWRIRYMSDGRASIQNVRYSEYYLAYDEPAISYRGIIVHRRAFGWVLKPVQTPNKYLLVAPDGPFYDEANDRETELVLSDIPHKCPRTALVPLAPTPERILEQAWTIKKVLPDRVAVTQNSAEKLPSFRGRRSSEAHIRDDGMIFQWDE